MSVLMKLNVARLSVVEFGQHNKTILEGLQPDGDGFINDPILIGYVNALENKSTIYDGAILQVLKSDETARIVSADKDRDVAVSAAWRMINAHELSEVTAELDAVASL